ncbi:MAG: ParB/RepB/Spo0J family partition protein [Rhodospirillaceae bacterium]|nr:ParB/RepB/Spo0J family partition protein [Rhodospirillaceae bacterium]
MNAETTKRKTLGRGLNALFGEQDGDGDSSAPASTKSATTLPVDVLTPSPLQPRKHFDEPSLNELAASIKEKGILQPLLVRPDPNTPGRYEIIAGERRWRAAQRAQVHDVPVLVRELSDSEVLEVALIENLQRQDLSPAEEARGYQRLIDDFAHTQEEISEIVGKSRTHVANLLRLLNLPDGVLRLIDDGKLSAGQAKPLVGLKNAEALAHKITRRGLSVRQSERLAKGHGKTKRVMLRAEKDADTRALEITLENATGYSVDISFDGKGGGVAIAYANLEQLDDIVKRLSTGGKRGKADNARDPGTVDIEELLKREGFDESEEPRAADDHTAPYTDPAANDVGAAGAVGREEQKEKPDIMDDFGLSNAIEESLKPAGHFSEDHGAEAPSPAAHEDHGADEVGAAGATHR